MQLTPDGDDTQTGARWNSVGYGAPLSFPWIAAPAAPRAQIATKISDPFSSEVTHDHCPGIAWYRLNP